MNAPARKAPLHLDPSRVPAFRGVGASEHGGGTAVIEVLDYHTGGEPFRMIVAGAPRLRGDGILAMRRDAASVHDAVRTLLMWEPRGHADMYGGWLVPPERPGADVGILFMHNEGWSTMCGHGTIALATALIETGAVDVTGAVTQIRVDAPCGPLEAWAYVHPHELDAARRDGRTPRVHRVAFENVPSYAAALDVDVEVPGFGPVRFDVGYGGAYYAVLPAERLGVQVTREGSVQAVAAARALVDAARAQLSAGGPAAATLGVTHPFEDDLSFLYGAILTGPAEDPDHHDRNLCVFADGEVDRSPTGSGVSARLAIMHARGQVASGQVLRIESILGADSTFDGEIARVVEWAGRTAIVPRVHGTAHVVGSARFVVPDGDRVGRGFLLPR